MKMASKPWSIMSCMLLLIFFNTQVCGGGNDITTGQYISGNKTIISQGGIFELGFFKPGNTSDDYYLGIWYKNISPQTVVWVASRNRPVKDPYLSFIKLSEEGVLELGDQYCVFWSSSSTLGNATIAVLLDDGNFVLRNGSESNSSSVVLWQSFDHPTDTWLPGAKLTSESPISTWWNPEKPAKGILSLVPDTNKSTLIFQYDWDYTSHEYWTWSWNGNNFGSVEQSLTKYIKFSFVSNANESYFIYSVHNISIPTRLVVNLLGGMQLLMWSMSLQKWNLVTIRPNFCGVNSWKHFEGHECKCLTGFKQRSPSIEWKSGFGPVFCEREKELQCGRQENDAFYVMGNMQLVKSLVAIQVGDMYGCKTTCLEDCYCAAYAYTNSCMIWHGELLSLQQVSPTDAGNDLHIRIAASELRHLTGRNPRGRVYVAIAVTGIILFLCAIMCITWWKCWKRIFTVEPSLVSLVSYKYSDLRRATNNFSDELGRGGFGTVFRGTMSDSTIIAVKRLGCFAGEKQFRSEVNTIGMIQHVNLIRLRGFCAEGSKRLLVFDCMGNGSLNSYLFQSDSKVLEWKTRYQIALGIARGLQYLHEKCRDCIIHCDIKPENILLDSTFNPLIADFGLAKLVGRQFSKVLTTMRGTRGYLAPEWISGVPITPKADVYSYGMMLFEIISGRRNLDIADDDMINYFPARVANKVNKGEEILSLLDKRLEGYADIKELTKACGIACWCIQDDEKDRPSMGQIVHALEGLSEVGISPFPSFLQAILHDQTSTKNPIHPCEVGSNTSVSSKDKNINSWTSFTPSGQSTWLNSFG